MDELKSSFDAAVHDIAAPPADVRRVMARGQRARVWRGVAGAAMSVGVLGCVLWAAATIRSPQPEQIRPTQDDPSFARYEIELGQGFNPYGDQVRGGFVEVDLRDNEICVEAAVRGVTPRHLHRRDGGNDVSLPDSSASRSCHIVPREVARDILGNHEQWYIEFHHQRSGETIRSDLVPLPQSPAEDRVASEVLEHLRRHVHLCRGFDFQFKDQLEEIPYRPVQCGADIRFPAIDELPTTDASGIVTEPPGEPRYVRGPEVVVYGFQNRESRDAWLTLEQPPLSGRIYGGRWVIDVMERNLYRRVAAGPPPGAEEAVGPSDRLSFGNRTIAPAGDSKTSVSLSRAVGKARDQEELLGAELVVYSDDDFEPVKAWHIILRRCVVNYGGTHADEACDDEQTHVIVDARSATILARFVT